MKECKVSLVGGLIDCSSLSGDKCALLDNGRVPGGNLVAMPQVFKSMSTEILEEYKSVHSPGGILAKDCKASPQIAKAATLVLNDRQQG